VVHCWKGLEEMVKSPHWRHESHGGIRQHGTMAAHRLLQGWGWELPHACAPSGHPSIRNATRLRSWPEILRGDSHQHYKVLKRGQTRQRHCAVGSWPSPAPPAPRRGQCGYQVLHTLCWGLFLVSTVWFALQKETQNANLSFLLWKSL